MVANLLRFEKEQITPGVYRDIVLNQTIIRANVNFLRDSPDAACLTTENLDAMGVNTDAFPA
ncbi:FimD/PapC N-terminal domain-containing protein [Escherichia coli]